MPTVNAGFGDGLNGLSGRELLESRGPVLYVNIGLDTAYRAGQTGQPGRPDIPAIPLQALVDTGAVRSCVDSELAEVLGLPVVDSHMIAGAHGAATVDVYLAQIYVPDLEFVIAGHLAAANLAASRHRYFALLGRDFLSNFTMVYEGGTGLVAISND